MSDPASRPTVWVRSDQRDLMTLHAHLGGRRNHFTLIRLVSAVLAVISYYGIERRCLTLKRR